VELAKTALAEDDWKEALECLWRAQNYDQQADKMDEGDLLVEPGFFFFRTKGNAKARRDDSCTITRSGRSAMWGRTLTQRFIPRITEGHEPTRSAHGLGER